MEPKKIALLVGAVVVALVTAILARQMFVKSAAPVASAAPVFFSQPTGPKVLVATHALPVGTILSEADFKFQPWPKDLIKGAYYVEGKLDKNSVRGSVVRNEMAAGQPLTTGSFVQPGDRGFLAAALGPGMRAITIATRPESGVAGFIFPGDRVDIMLTQSVDGGSGGGSGGPPLRTSETIVRNMRVLATDQRTASEDKDGKKEVKTFNTVTLEATPRIAEKIAVAQQIGQLTLSLRPIADNTAELERAIASGEVNVPTSGDPKADRKMALNIAAQPLDTNPTFVTGADVSRFQRRSAPSIGPVATRPTERVPAGGTGPEAPKVFPTVKVARGNSVTEVPIGGK